MAVCLYVYGIMNGSARALFVKYPMAQGEYADVIIFTNIKCNLTVYRDVKCNDDLFWYQ